MLQRHKAGEKMFVDWAGLKMPITDPQTGERWEAPVFVSAMGSSQFIFAKAFASEELRWWLKGHVDAFEAFGGVPEIVVPDNLKTGVQRSCRYEPALNLSYAELAAFYGVAVVPARVRKPRDKAKVENAVQQVERWALAPLRDRIFFSLEEANAALAEQIQEINGRLMKGPGCSRSALFEAEDKPAMRPLPEDRYVYADWKRVKVGPDYHVQAEGRLYSVPFGLCGKQVDVRVSGALVEVFHSGKRVASHLRRFGGRGPVTLQAHMPSGHWEHAKWTPARMSRWARAIGPSTAAFAERLMESKAHPEQGFRACMGLVSLAKAYDPARIESACAKALVLGALSYRNVKDMLARGIEAMPAREELPALPSHGNVRGGSYYAGQEALCAR
jgi:transposase